MNLVTRLASTLLVAVTLLACQDPAKAPAAAALQVAESSLAAVRGEADRFAPGQLKGVIAELDAARAAFAAGKYAEALAATRPLGDRIAALGRESSDRKDALLVNWSSLSASVPEALGVVGGLVDALTSMARLPQGVDPAARRSGTRDDGRGPIRVGRGPGLVPLRLPRRGGPAGPAPAREDPVRSGSPGPVTRGGPAALASLRDSSRRRCPGRRNHFFLLIVVNLASSHHIFNR